MKVILSVEPIKFPLTGIGRYTWELARHLEQSGSISDLKYFTGNRFLEFLPGEHQSSTPMTGLSSIKKWVQNSHLASETYRRLMPLLRAKILKGCEDYLYHGPNFYLPPFSGKRVATFHDLSPFTWAQCQTPQRARFMQKELNKTIKCADALITDSDYTRKELAEYFNWPIEKIHSIPLAAANDFYPRTMVESTSVLHSLNLTYNSYTLFVGTIEPRKNILTLLDAYSQLPLELRRRWPLVLAGYQGWQSDLIHERIGRAEREGWACYVGFVANRRFALSFFWGKAVLFSIII